MNKSLLIIALIFVSASLYAKPKQNTLTAPKQLIEEQLMKAFSKGFGETNSLTQLTTKTPHQGAGFQSSEGALTSKNKKGLAPAGPYIKSAK